MDPAKKKPVIVAGYSKKTITGILDSVGPEDQVIWAYLGKNVSTFLEIKTIFGTRGENIPVGELLQANAAECRQDFIDLLGEYAAGFEDSLWYLTSISEKNPFVSDLYLNFCYLKTAIDLINSRVEPFFIIFEDPCLVKAIGDNTGAVLEREIRLSPTFSHSSRMVQKTIRRIMSKSVFVSRFMLRICLARAFRLLRSRAPEQGQASPILIHAWTDERSFAQKNKFVDIYFGRLSEKIEKFQKEYFLFLDVLPTMFYPHALLKLVRLEKPCRLFEEFISFSDVIHSLSVTSGIPTKTYSNAVLSGLDIVSLLTEETEKDRQTARAELSYLYFCAGKKIASSCNPRSIFYTFENHIWEKMLIVGIRKISRKVRLIGYAHATVNTMELSYSVSGAEKQIIPLPDHILVNGKTPKKVLTDSGFDPARIFILGSLRFGSMHLPPPQKPQTGRKTILVVLSADINRSLEMISKVRDAFLHSPDVSIVFKPHPIQKISRILQHTGDLPLHFTVSTASLDALLERTDMVIFSDSTASVEAAARGIPILHLTSDFLIDINIFDQSSIVRSVGDPQEIQTVSEELFRLRRDERIRYQELVHALFSPINDDVLEQEITC